MKIGFTGTQNQNLPTAQKISFITMLERWKDAEEFHHGDCIGADAYAHGEAIRRRIPIYVHPPINLSKRAFVTGYTIMFPEKDYLDRNKDIVNATDMLVAMPKSKFEEVRSGTWSTVRYARKLKRPITIIWPDGKVLIEKLN